MALREERDQHPLIGMRGVLEDASHLVVDDMFCAKMNGIDIFKNGILRSLPGFAEYADLGGSDDMQGTGTFNAKFIDGTAGIVHCFGKSGSGFIKKDDYDGTLDAISDGGSWAEPTSADPVSMVMFWDGAGNNIIIGCNGNDEPFKINSSWQGDLLGGSPDVFKYAAVYKTYLFVGNIEGNPNYVYYSDSLDGQSGLDGSNVIAFPSEVKGLAVFADRLWIFTEDAIYNLSGYTEEDFVLKDVDNVAVGTVNHFSIVVDNESMYWCSDSGFYAMDRNFSIRNISRDVIQETWDGRNKNQVAKIVGTKDSDRNQIIWAVPQGTSTYPDKLYIFNYRKQGWTFSEDFDVGSIRSVKLDDGTTEIYMGNGQANDLVYSFSSDGLNGSAMRKYVQDHPRHQGDPYALKYYRGIEVVADMSGNYNLSVKYTVHQDSYITDDPSVSVEVNLDPDAAEWDDVDWDDFDWVGVDDARKRFFIPVNQAGRLITVAFENLNANQDIIIYGYTIVYQLVPEDPA